MNSRLMLQAALAEVLGELPIYTNLQPIGEQDPAVEYFAHAVRGRWEPTNTQGQLLSSWELWLCTTLRDDEEAEASLEVLFAAVLPVLEQLDWLVWTTAEMDTHPDNFHAIRVTITTTANTTV